MAVDVEDAQGGIWDSNGQEVQGQSPPQVSLENNRTVAGTPYL